MALIGEAKKLFASQSKALSAAIYTEVSDIEDELNGLITYDRQVRFLWSSSSHCWPMSAVLLRCYSDLGSCAWLME